MVPLIGWRGNWRHWPTSVYRGTTTQDSWHLQHNKSRHKPPCSISAANLFTLPVLRIPSKSFRPLNRTTSTPQCASTQAPTPPAMAAMLEFRTKGYNPYAVKYSPYYDSRLAVAASSNFGIVGNGRVFALGLTAQGVQVEKTYVFGPHV